MQAAVFATNSGKRLRGVGDLDNAVAQFQAAIAAVPGYAPAHYELGLTLKLQGKPHEALVEFQTAKKLDPRLEIPRF